MKRLGVGQIRAHSVGLGSHLEWVGKDEVCRGARETGRIRSLQEITSLFQARKSHLMFPKIRNLSLSPFCFFICFFSTFLSSCSLPSFPSSPVFPFLSFTHQLSFFPSFQFSFVFCVNEFIVLLKKIPFFFFLQVVQKHDRKHMYIFNLICLLIFFGFPVISLHREF